MRFHIPSPQLAEQWPEASQAYIAGLDGRIYPTKAEIVEGLLVCRRPSSESGKLSVAWPVENIGRPVLTTTSLIERDKPYILSLELARGKLSEIRDQCAAWEMARMLVPERFRELQAEAFRCFAHASAMQHDLARTEMFANESISRACQAADVLADAYVVQRMASIRKSSSHAPGLLGCTLDESVHSEPGGKLFSEHFTTASVNIDWRAIEGEEGQYHWQKVDDLVQWCAAERILMRGGPLISLSENGLPQWLAPWKDDFLNLPSFVCDFVETAVARYTGLIRMWEVSAGGNVGGALGLSEEHRLALVARVLETAIRTDSDSQFFVRIEQPWGEYQRLGQHRLSPYQFVDALIRSNIGLTGVSLDLSFGYSQRSSQLRDMLTISKLVDIWSLLGVQVHVNLAIPSRSTPDAMATEGIDVVAQERMPGWTEEEQAELIERLVPMLLVKPAVTGVFLHHFSDSCPHQFPHAGLLRPDGTMKPMVRGLMM